MKQLNLIQKTIITIIIVYLLYNLIYIFPNYNNSIEEKVRFAENELNLFWSRIAIVLIISVVLIILSNNIKNIIFINAIKSIKRHKNSIILAISLSLIIITTLFVYNKTIEHKIITYKQNIKFNKREMAINRYKIGLILYDFTNINTWLYKYCYNKTMDSLNSTIIIKPHIMYKGFYDELNYKHKKLVLVKNFKQYASIIIEHPYVEPESYDAYLEVYERINDKIKYGIIHQLINLNITFNSDDIINNNTIESNRLKRNDFLKIISLAPDSLNKENLINSYDTTNILTSKYKDAEKKYQPTQI